MKILSVSIKSNKSML